MHIFLDRTDMRALRIVLGLLVAVVAVLLAASASPPQGKAAFPGANGKIAFTSGRDGNGEIYLIDANGGSPTNVTNDSGGDDFAAWSPDGTKIAFNSNRDGGEMEIYVMDADGTDQTRLTNNAVSDDGAAWSPDGGKIVFARSTVGIVVMNADGTGPTTLIADPSSALPNYYAPAWSPDGTEIALTVPLTSTSQEICVVSASDGSVLRCTSNGVNTRLPDWSADGSQIAFDRGPAGSANVYVMNSDLSGQTQLTFDGASENAVWSPDSTQIAFEKFAPSQFDIWVMNANGSGPTNVTPGTLGTGGSTGYDYGPSWQPLDVTPPTITITTPPEGAGYTLGQVVLADYACADQVGGTGLASCVGDVADGSAIDTLSVGAKTFMVDAEDHAGNPASATHNYTVVYDFTGFFAPVDNPGPAPPFVFNVAKAGSAIPVKFSLGGDQGLNIFAAGYPKSQPIYCDASATYDGIEETVTAGSSSLSYDATTDRYTYVWKTEKAWANTCRKLTVRLNDGTDHVAYFNLKK